MLISYNKLWKLLIDNKKMNKTDLKDQAGITYNILARLGKCLESLYKICKCLDCNIQDIYTSGYVTSRVRSNYEQLLEQYCENCDDIDWVYKNGDTGQQYFSIVYMDAFQNQWLFYPDYIVMKKDGTTWIIETKGGEIKGLDKNIDKQIGNKFNAFKRYAEEKNLQWGFCVILTINYIPIMLNLYQSCQVIIGFL